MRKHNIQNASAFATKQLGNKLNKVLSGEGRQRRRTAEAKAACLRTEKHVWYCELVIAACLGGALVLSFVLAHQMLTTEWAW
jgi:predicted Co/Zn/Cd cation transporter (cation efflux family)